MSTKITVLSYKSSQNLQHFKSNVTFCSKQSETEKPFRVSLDSQLLTEEVVMDICRRRPCRGMHPRNATLYELIETFAGINFARGCGNAVSCEVRNIGGMGIAILMHLLWNVTPTYGHSLDRCKVPARPYLLLEDSNCTVEMQCS